jgi:hypothetical protein
MTIFCFCTACIALNGCGDENTFLAGYSNQSLFPDDIESVYVQMFENQGFRRGVEYELTDALAKRIEADTPYKVISSPDRADTIMTGRIVAIGSEALVIERETGRALQSEVRLEAVVNWKDLKTGQLLIDSQTVGAAASYSQWQNQTFDYAANLAANNLAVKIVELMEKTW